VFHTAGFKYSALKKDVKSNSLLKQSILFNKVRLFPAFININFKSFWQHETGYIFFSKLAA